MTLASGRSVASEWAACARPVVVQTIREPGRERLGNGVCHAGEHTSPAGRRHAAAQIASLGTRWPLGTFAARTTWSARSTATGAATPPLVEVLGERFKLGAIELAIAVGVERKRMLDESLGRRTATGAALATGSATGTALTPLSLAGPAFPATRARAGLGAAFGRGGRVSKGRCRGDHDRGEKGQPDEACERHDGVPRGAKGPRSRADVGP